MVSRKLSGLCLFLTLATVCLVSASPRLGAQTAEADASYKIAADDVLRIDVIGRSGLSGSYVVDAAGMVTVPIVGAVRAAGRTPKELASDLSRRYSLVDRDIPRVTVTVAEYRSRKIFVLGAVLVPGTYSFSNMPTVWEAINQAGGPAQDAQLSSVEVVPQDMSSGRATATVDVAKAIREGRVDSLPRLRPGDTVRVPRGGAVGGLGPGVVYVFGAVGVPGAKPMEQAPDLITALMSSGGPAPDANLSHVEIIRTNGARLVHLKVNLKDYLHEANAWGNPSLEPGDTVYLPRSEGGPKLLKLLGVVGPVIGLATTIVVLVRR